MINNLAQIVQLVKGRDPQTTAMSIIKNSNINDPTISQLIAFAQSGDMNSVVNLANTYFAEKGIDFNTEFNTFMSMLK